jgi:hypothetical protein
VGPRAGLDGYGKSPPSTGIRFPDRPARSESLYRLSYTGPYRDVYIYIYIYTHTIYYMRVPSI